MKRNKKKNPKSPLTPDAKRFGWLLVGSAVDYAAAVIVHDELGPPDGESENEYAVGVAMELIDERMDWPEMDDFAEVNAAALQHRAAAAFLMARQKGMLKDYLDEGEARFDAAVAEVNEAVGG